jgi:8-oxo-dGTP pyrophosphatase MutT (NUDIX family)
MSADAPFAQTSSAQSSSAQIAFAEVDAIESRYHARDWPFAQARAGEIASHWAALRRERPGLFDGRVLLADEWRVEARASGPALVTRHFDAPFSAFLAWRDFGFPDSSVRNCFAAAVLMARDGAYVLGRMGAQTANAGRVYFPCGTPDMSDLRAGGVDLAGSVLRELEEETGLAPGEVACDPGWTLVFEGARLACMKIVRSPLPAEALVARIEAFLRAQKEPELCGVHVARGPGDLLPAMPPFTRAFLARRFAAQPG